ncbi:hypothetical protein GO755_07735 [Spirosoma sp. HMF4905]|uniref:Uncharacterized protein n=1 Tax=Spirosoma arboris TaxID=2682092 RepID=A0A7K1S818_9BACT|nr:hypothetical protein [Spirosoma arboris]MVM29919.1 hypothetical protein [Spirosoma arboris]
MPTSVSYLSGQLTGPFLSHAQIEAMPDSAIKSAYENVKIQLANLQRRVQNNSGLLAELTEEIQAFTRQVVWLRARKFPDYFED